MTPILVLLAGMAITAPPADTSAAPADAAPRVVEVEMIDKSSTEFVFDPSRITARPGDVIRFVQRGAMPHNVEFKGAPGGASIDEILMGPYLTRKGETYDIVIDDRFTPGEYPFVCTPHQFLKMTGVLSVEARSEGTLPARTTRLLEEVER